MCEIVGKHRGQFGLVVGGEDQPAIDAHIAAGRAKALISGESIAKKAKSR